MKIVKSLKDCDPLTKCVSQTIENETKEQRGGFLGLLLGTQSWSLLQNMLEANGVIRAGDGVIRARQDF